MGTFFTTERKKIIATIGLIISAWVALSTTTVISMPELPAIITTPYIGGFTILFASGLATLFTVYMIWFEY